MKNKSRSNKKWRRRTKTISQTRNNKRKRRKKTMNILMTGMVLVEKVTKIKVRTMKIMMMTMITLVEV